VLPRCPIILLEVFNVFVGKVLFHDHFLQEEFKTLEEKATKVLEDYEKAQVSQENNFNCFSQYLTMTN